MGERVGKRLIDRGRLHEKIKLPAYACTIKCTARIIQIRLHRVSITGGGRESAPYLRNSRHKRTSVDAPSPRAIRIRKKFPDTNSFSEASYEYQNVFDFAEARRAQRLNY